MTSGPERFDGGKMIRAARRTRCVSQRELAARAGVPNSTVARLEAAQVTPRLDTFLVLINALGYDIVLNDGRGRLLTVDEESDRLVDRSGRRFPAHLKSGPTPNEIHGYWWGYYRIAWWRKDPVVPDHTYWHRWKIANRGLPWSEKPWEDAT